LIEQEELISKQKQENKKTEVESEIDYVALSERNSTVMYIDEILFTITGNIFNFSVAEEKV
jgi:hypothetical protein